LGECGSALTDGVLVAILDWLEEIMFDSPADSGTSSVSVEKWFEAYQLAVLELNHAKMRVRIVQARNAILDRAEEIMTDSPTDERRLLKDALHVLDVLEGIAAKSKPAA
jgi:hypothetical protein